MKVNEIPQGLLGFEFESPSDKENFSHISIMKDGREFGAIYYGEFNNDGNTYSEEEMKEVRKAVEIIKQHLKPVRF